MKLRYSLMLGALLILAGTSCEDKLDIPQKGVLDFSTYYKTDEQAQAAADALYIQLKGTYYNDDEECPFGRCLGRWWWS